MSGNKTSELENKKKYSKYILFINFIEKYNKNTIKYKKNHL